MTAPPGEAPIAAVRATLAFLVAFESVQRRMHPPAIPALRAWLAPHAEEVARSLRALRADPARPDLVPFYAQVEAAAAAADEAAQAFLAPAPPAEAAMRLLGSFRLACRALEALYPLRGALPPVQRLFCEPALHDRLGALDPSPPAGVSVGLHRAGPKDDPDARGGFTLYVPERYDGAQAWPLVVALHGAFGHGRDFVWTWLREARSRPALLLAPTSQDTTWSLHQPERDTRALFSMLEFVRERWRVDAARVLVTGLSDGGTFSLLAGLAEGSPFTHIAPVSGVLHPATFRGGHLARARGRKIRLVHGALDWLFPVALAHAARDALAEAGADLVYREIADLSHTYPREENAHILDWLG